MMELWSHPGVNPPGCLPLAAACNSREGFLSPGTTPDARPGVYHFFFRNYMSVGNLRRKTCCRDGAVPLAGMPFGGVRTAQERRTAAA